MRSAPLWTASSELPVAQVPSGNVKLHQVGANGSPPGARAVRRTIAAAIASHSIAKPQTGTP